MTDITSKVHDRADVELAEQIRQELAVSRGLEPRDYSHYTTRAVQTKKNPAAVEQPGLKVA